MADKSKVYVSEVKREIQELDILSKQADKMSSVLRSIRDSKDKEKENIIKELNSASDCDVIATLFKIQLKLSVIRTSLEKKFDDSQIDNPGYIW